MKKFLILVMFGAVYMSACKKISTEPSYKQAANIYFDWSDSTGTDASRVDSLAYTFALNPARTIDTEYLPVRIAGDRMSKDRFFKLAVVDTATTAKVGTHYKALDSIYKMPADSGLVHVPVYFYSTDTSLHSKSVHVRFILLPTTDFTTTDLKYNYAKISISNMLTKPTWWDIWSSFLFDYSQVKFGLFISVTGRTSLPLPTDFNNAPIAFFVLNKFQAFLRDPIQWTSDNADQGFKMDPDGNGNYWFYNSSAPTDRYLLQQEEDGSYHFHDENGNAIQ